MGFMASAKYLAELQARAEKAATLRKNVGEFTDTLRAKVYPVRVDFELDESALIITAIYRSHGYKRIIDFDMFTESFLSMLDLAKLEAERINKSMPI
jgi:hypothetical protein